MVSLYMRRVIGLQKVFWRSFPVEYTESRKEKRVLSVPQVELDREG